MGLPHSSVSAEPEPPGVQHLLLHDESGSRTFTGCVFTGGGSSCCDEASSSVHHRSVCSLLLASVSALLDVSTTSFSFPLFLYCFMFSLLCP